MISLPRAVRCLGLRARFDALGADPGLFEFWCAAKNLDPRGLLGALPGPAPPWRQGWEHPRRGPDQPPLLHGDPRGDGWTPLHEACHLGQGRAADALLEGRPGIAGARDSQGCSPLRALFLFNDTSPGWKHGGLFFEGEGPERLRAPIGLDADLAAIARQLLARGARLRGGELCAAAYLGLPLCVEALLGVPHACEDEPDALFPEWALFRGFIGRALGAPRHAKPAALAPAVACALDGDAPWTALPIALASRPIRDGQHAKAFCEAGRHRMAEKLLHARPQCAQAMLGALCASTRAGSVDGPPESSAELARACLRLGADPHRSSDADPSLMSPFEIAAREGRPELIDEFDRASQLAEPQLQRAMTLLRRALRADPAPYARAAAIVEGRMMALDMPEADAAPAPRAANKRL